MLTLRVKKKVFTSPTFLQNVYMTIIEIIRITKRKKNENILMMVTDNKHFIRKKFKKHGSFN